MAKPKGTVRNDRVVVPYSAEEFERLKMLFARSRAHVISSYIRKVSLEGPVEIVTRNGSFDAFVEEIVVFRKQMMSVFEQGQWSAEDRDRLIRLQEEIGLLITKIAALCMPQ